MKNSLIDPAQRNPSIKRVIFIATPHCGSPLAGGSLAAFAIRLIRIPADLLEAIEEIGRSLRRHAASYGLRIKKIVFPQGVNDLFDPQSVSTVVLGAAIVLALAALLGMVNSARYPSNEAH